MERMLLEARHRADRDLGGETDLKPDLTCREVDQEIRVFDGSGAMADSGGAQRVNGGPNGPWADDPKARGSTGPVAR